MAINPEQLAQMQAMVQQQGGTAVPGSGQIGTPPPPDPLQLTTQLYVHIAQRALKDDLNVDIATASLKTLADAMNVLGTDPQADMQLKREQAQLDAQIKQQQAHLDMQIKIDQARLDMALKQEQAGLQLQQKQTEAALDAQAEAQNLQMKQEAHQQKMSQQAEMAQAKAAQTETQTSDPIS